MNGRPARSFVIFAAPWALGTCLLVGFGFGLVRPVQLGWGVLGAVVMVATGLLQGAAMSEAHGRPDKAAQQRFLLAMGGGMLLRLLLAAAGGLAVFPFGQDSAVAYAVGLAGGYFPMLLAESLWFTKRGPQTVTTEPEGSVHA